MNPFMENRWKTVHPNMHFETWFPPPRKHNIITKLIHSCLGMPPLFAVSSGSVVESRILEREAAHRPLAFCFRYCVIRGSSSA
jgi:hypothetical protein